MAINQVRPDTPLADTPEPRFVNDTIKQKTWQQMSVVEKGSKKNELIKKGGMQRFLQYKDSISTDATNRREAEINKSASSKGMIRAEYEKWYKKNKNKPDAPTSGLCTDKSDGGKGSCTTGVKSEKRTLRDIR